MDLRARSDELIETIAEHLISVERISTFVKVLLVVCGTALVAYAQCASISNGGQWTSNTVIGLVGTGLACVGGLFVAFNEPSAAKALRIAHDAIEDARESEEANREVEQLYGEITRGTELYGAVTLMVKAIEKGAPFSGVPSDSIAQTLVEISSRCLKIALDFKLAEHWTLGVYRIDTELDGCRILRCVAHTRSEECPLDQARVWPEGRGAGWIAIANNNDVVIPDIQSPSMGTIFDGMLRDGDLVRYRSVAAVPITAALGVTWGAVVATSDRANHFEVDQIAGVRPVEAVRALAGMMALALTIQDSAPATSRA